MQVPLQIAFLNLDKSDWAEEEIRRRVDKLETLYSRLTACRVTVDRPARKDGQARPAVVNIEMSVPGYKDLVVTQDPRQLQERFQEPDLGNAINDAFAAAERRLIDFKRQREGRSQAVQSEHAQEQYLGQVADVQPEKDHGFLLTNDGRLLYFHRNSVIQGDFDRLQRGDQVHYVEIIGDTGPIAYKVRVPG